MAEIERLNEELRFPLPQGDKIDWPYIREIIGILEEELGKKTNVTINLLLDQTGNTAIWYFGAASDVGAYVEGTWRIFTSSTDYTVQRFDGSDWVTKYNLDSDGLGTITDLSISSPSAIYTLSHDQFADFLAEEHFTEASIDHANIIAGDGSDHSDVALNTTHRTSDGKDHSDVALNNTHRTSNGSDHSYIDQSVTIASSPTHNALTLTNPLAVTSGGTGNTSLTDHAILVGSGTDGITPIAAGTNGQIPIGFTGMDPQMNEIDGTPNQIQVTNAPASITISIPDTDATGSELETLTDTSNADALHVHAHSAVTGKTANDHHNESHTVASHSDTTATGTELETLTDGSNADSLHGHAHDSTTGYVAAEHISHPTGGDGTYTVYNDGTVGNVTGFTVANGLITSVTEQA